MAHRYVGDDNGTVSVVQFDEKQAQLTRLPYCIPAHVTLGEDTLWGFSVCLPALTMAQTFPVLDLQFLHLRINRTQVAFVGWLAAHGGMCCCCCFPANSLTTLVGLLGDFRWDSQSG
jgi:hypothetical protein